LERKLASNITSTSTDHVVNTRWNPPATQHNQSATKISTSNFDHTQLHTPTITHCVKRWTPPATLQKQHNGVLAGKNNNNAPVVEFAPPPPRENSYSRLGDVVGNVAQPLPRREDSYARLGDVVPIKNTQFVNLIPNPPATTTMTPSHNNDNGGGGNFPVHWSNPPYNSNMNTNYKNSDREGRPWFPPTPPPPPHHNHRRDEFRPAVNNNYYYTNNNINNNKNGESLGFNDEQYGLPTYQQKHDNISDDRITTYDLVEGHVDDIDRGGGEVGEFYHRGNNRRSDKSESSLLLHSERVKCITTNNKNMRDEDLDEIIKELETSNVLSEIKLSNNVITLADGRFMTALASNTSIRKIKLHDNKIGDEGVRSLCAALKVNNTLSCISLNGNQISKVGAQFLAEALMVNTVLQSLSLHANKIGDEGVQSLCAALKVNNTLRCINLNGCQISKVGAQFLAEALMVNTVLQRMSLQSNNVGEDGAQRLAKALKVNNTLRCINLSKCQISEVGAQFLTEALMVNTELEDMNLSANKIGDEGVQSLCAALEVNKILKSIDLNENQISKVGAKFLAEALMVNIRLETFNVNGNMIGDEGAQSLAESFTINRSLRNMQLSTNRITDIGATQLADAIEFNCDCVLTTISLKGNKVSISLLDRIKSIFKAKHSSKSKELSSTTLHHDGIIADEQHNAPAVSAVITQPENTPETENVSSVAMVREHHRQLKRIIVHLWFHHKCTNDLPYCTF
jgi:Ran GTPase-activating protein (RanGAP) involved in mRNA processing and transport